MEPLKRKLSEKIIEKENSSPSKKSRDSTSSLTPAKEFPRARLSVDLPLYENSTLQDLSSLEPSRPSMEMLRKKISETNFPYCEDVSKYKKIAKIGQGTFGEVFKAAHKQTKQTVALKKVLMENEKEGFPITAIREVKILQLLKHENVVNLIEICRSRGANIDGFKSTFYLVFEFCEHDLAGLLGNTNVKFSLGEIKMVLKQLLNGLYFIHSNRILHRDMKASNILLTKNGTLKLADFGLARGYTPCKDGRANRYTNRVVTLWYRPPELLLGERNYGPPVDMWGAGCIMAEMFTRTPIMQGSNEQHQLLLICQLCGVISPETFPGVENLELFEKIELPKGLKRAVKTKLKPHLKDRHALDLLENLLVIDPVGRIDSDTALNHNFFWLDPLPSDLAHLLSKYTKSMFEFTYKLKPQNPLQPKVNPKNDGQYYDMVF